MRYVIIFEYKNMNVRNKEQKNKRLQQQNDITYNAPDVINIALTKL